jgi:hypothetical protein
MPHPPVSEMTRVELLPDDWYLVGNVLNEVLNGFLVSDFENSIGISRADAQSTLIKIRQLGKAEPLGLDVSLVPGILKALEVVISELSSADFSTRTGRTLEEAYLLANKLRLIR